jgi:putative transposase
MKHDWTIRFGDIYTIAALLGMALAFTLLARSKLSKIKTTDSIIGLRLKSLEAYMSGIDSELKNLTASMVMLARQVEVMTAQGRPVVEAIRSIGVTEVTYYRLRSEYGGLKGDQVKRLKELETENNRLRRAVSDLTIEKLILKEAAQGNF